MEYLQTVIKNLPHGPGIYLFKNSDGVVLYVGKAKDLKNRVSGYATNREAIGEKTRLLVAQSTHIEIIRTNSEFDALLLEASCIHKWQPKYNVIAKDDKSPLYVLIRLDEELPAVLLVRKPKKLSRKDVLVGPFQSGRIAKNLLRHIRTIIPFCTQKRRDGKPCFYTHLGLCRPCPSFINKLPRGDLRSTLMNQYRQNMFRLRNILTGKATSITDDLEREMKHYAQNGQYEEAATVRNRLKLLPELLNKRYDPSLYFADTDFSSHVGLLQGAGLLATLRPFYPDIPRLHRIECFDISNIGGTAATGSMVVAIDGVMDRSLYRKFRVRLAQGPNDVAMMTEVIHRRLTHDLWPYPDLFVVDGGAAQLGGVQAILSESACTVPVIGLAKRHEEIIIPIKKTYRSLRLLRSDPGLQLLEKLRDEAHRFAHAYHLLLRKKRFSATVGLARRDSVG